MTGIYKIIACLVILSCVPVNDGSRILAIFPVNTKSHFYMFSALMKGLVKEGHQVDVVSHFPLKNPPPNYRDLVDLTGTFRDYVNNFTIDFVKILRRQSTYAIANNLGNEICEIMGTERMQKFIKNLPNGPKYDLVLTEAFAADCYMGFGHLLKVPVVAVSSAIEYPWINAYIGNNDNLAYVPTSEISEFNGMNFWQRLQNVYQYHLDTYSFNSYTGKVQTELMRKYLSPDMPHVREIEKSIALLLVNSHNVIFGVKPITPSLVQVAGLHIGGKDESELSPSLKQWLDESKDGVVYFSFGTLVLIESLPPETLKDIYKAFAEIAPVRVLMRIHQKKNLLPGLPSNVRTETWMSQQAILAHNNTKAFITHGGLMGSQEALYYGVPMIGVPLFSDQPRNVAAFESKKMAVKVDYDNLSYATLSQALKTVLNDPKYKENAEYYSKIFKDRPMSAMKTAIFWIEFVIRNGPHVLKSPALDLQWWQLDLLDVYGFILLNIIVGLLVVYQVTKFLLKKLLSPFTKVKKQKSQ